MDMLEVGLLYKLHKHGQNTEPTIPSRNRKKFLRKLSRIQRKLCDQQIPRAALQDPQASAWCKVLSSGSNQALITLTGFDYKMFDWLHLHFEPLYKNFSPFSTDGTICYLQYSGEKVGRPRLMNSRDCLGLILTWTRLRGSMVALQLIFGLTASSVSVYLRYS